MTRIAAATLVAIALTGTAVRSQESDPAPPATVERTAHRETVHDQQRSWTLFVACDRNGDDRLDILEAANCALVDPRTRDRARFRALDLDADGFLNFPEFDTRYREVIERAGIFDLLVVGPIEFVPNPIRADASDDPTLLVLRAADTDRSGALSPEEFARCLADNGEDLRLAARFADFDRDGSGGLDTVEFGPILQFMTQVWRSSPGDAERRRTLPVEYRAADTNGDGLLDRGELDAALRLLNPSLARWTSEIFNAADKNGSQSLGGDELHRGRSAARATLDVPPAASAPGPRPQRRD